MKAKSIYGSILYHIIITTLGLLMLYPILWMIASSFKDNTEIFSNAHSLISAKLLNIRNYIEGWKGFGDVTFAVYFKNSLIISSVSAIGQVLFSGFVAYGFARTKFIGKKILFGLVIVTMLIPRQILMVPQYILFNKLGWINSFKPLILPNFFPLPFFIFLCLQFIQGLPMELDEAAKIDGCGKYSIYFRIILPNIKPALITCFIFSFYWTWQDFLSPLIYIESNKLYPVSLALKMFSDPSSVTNWGAMFAMSTLSVAPAFIIFLFFQRYLVEGITTTGIKG
jgi:multiple sugar transport system permease protein